MCVAVPARIIDMPTPTRGTVDLGGTRYPADLSLIEGAGVGDYVLLHAGFAIQKLDEAEAQATLALFRELTELTGAAGKQPPQP